MLPGAAGSLPSPIHDEIFNIVYRPTDVALGHLTDDISARGFTIVDIIDRDLTIYLLFRRDDISGSIRIDRLAKLFQIEAKSAGGHYLPGCGNWDSIGTYLDNLRACYGQR
jgi:hypothetical protein